MITCPMCKDPVPAHYCNIDHPELRVCTYHQLSTIEDPLDAERWLLDQENVRILEENEYVSEIDREHWESYLESLKDSPSFDY